MGRWENLWSSEKTSVIPLESTEGVVDKIRYTVCNPVEAQLVADPNNWPGVLMDKPTGAMPPCATLTIETPPILKHINPSMLRDEIAGIIKKTVTGIKETMRIMRLSFKGVRVVLKQRCADRPATRAPRCEINPHVSCKNKWHHIEALVRNKAFLAAYYEALASWRETKAPKPSFPQVLTP